MVRNLINCRDKLIIRPHDLLIRPDELLFRPNDLLICYCREFATHVRFLRFVYCLRIVAYGMTWTRRAAGSSGSGIRRASPAAAATASAGVILFALQPRGCLYAYVLASKRCKRL